MERAQTALHPTVLIGLGAYGKEVLQRLLNSAASRGALVWEALPSQSGRGSRRLQDFALVWLDNGSQEVPGIDALDDGPFELMGDLYAQIERIDAAEPEGLKRALGAAANRLLSLEARQSRPEGAPVGLDVFVLAHPTRTDIGLLDAQLRDAMTALAGNVTLGSRGANAQRLCFIEILDFDGFWSDSDTARDTRNAVFESVRRWEQRYESRDPSVGRVYLVDSSRQSGGASADYRAEEVAVFLEFLLFEGQRTEPESQRYYRRTENESPLATFGIRVYERSSGLLLRLAAARFGVSWLRYLGGERHDARVSGGPDALAGLEALMPERVEERISPPELDTLIVEKMRALEGEVLSVDADRDDWPEEIRNRCDEGLAAIDREIFAFMDARMDALNAEKVGRIDEEVDDLVSAALQGSDDPLPLGTITERLHRTLEALAPSEAAARDPGPPAADPYRDLLQRQQEYRGFALSQLDPERSRSWWWMASIVLAAGLSPLLVQAIRDLLSSWDPAGSYTTLRSLVALLGKPILAAITVLAGALAASLFGFLRAIRGRVWRAKRFYVDRERGRIADTLRRCLDRDGALAAGLMQKRERYLADFQGHTASAVQRALRRALGQLETRKTEVAWLEKQMDRFLRLHGIFAHRAEPGLHTGLSGSLSTDRRGGVRCTTELETDLDKVLSSEPPNEERFRAIQRSVAPFSGWNEPYGGRLLDALGMLDQLAQLYRDPLERERAKASSAGTEESVRAQELEGFVRSAGAHLAPAARLVMNEVSSPQTICRLPESWLGLRGRDGSSIDRVLRDLNCAPSRGRPGRAYLAKVHIGLDVAAVRGAP